MRQFSIKELERFSGIKAHTIRTWENRYGVLQPKRTPGNIRNYTLDDVKVLLNIGLLTKNGFRISQLVRLKPEEIEAKIKSLKDEQAQQDKTINSLIVCMLSSDVDEFECCLDTSVDDWGIDITIQKLIIPFLEKVDILSYKDNSIEVHFAVTAVRKKLIRGIEHIKSAPKMAKSAMFFLPKGEHYDLLLLYMTYITKSKGSRILYLGTNVPKENLELVIQDKKPDYLFTYLPAGSPFDTAGFSKFLQQHLPQSQLLVAEAEKIKRRSSGKNVQFFFYRDIEKVILPDQFQQCWLSSA